MLFPLTFFAYRKGAVFLFLASISTCTTPCATDCEYYPTTFFHELAEVSLSVDVLLSSCALSLAWAAFSVAGSFDYWQSFANPIYEGSNETQSPVSGGYLPFFVGAFQERRVVWYPTKLIRGPAYWCCLAACSLTSLAFFFQIASIYVLVLIREKEGAPWYEEDAPPVVVPPGNDRGEQEDNRSHAKSGESPVSLTEIELANITLPTTHATV